jgi:uncharacterized membrane protein YsdA (DUF1294 family)/cold shock CspA family protein
MEGRLARWNDGKGFGFIEVAGRKEDIFLHISALRGMPRRPVAGDRIRFALDFDEKGRSRASHAEIIGLKQARNGARRASGRRYRNEGRRLGTWAWGVMALPFVASAFYLWQTGNSLPMVLYLAMSLATFLAYAWDKKRAIDGAWRIPEANLHLLELFGGWPGGLLAQYRIRHKGSKTRYQALFWLIVLLHLLLWADHFLFRGRWIRNFLVSLT